MVRPSCGRVSTPVVALFRPHRHHRLDGRRATRRRETGEKRDTDSDPNAQGVNQRFHGGACQSSPGDRQANQQNREEESTSHTGDHELHDDADQLTGWICFD